MRSGCEDPTRGCKLFEKPPHFQDGEHGVDHGPRSQADLDLADTGPVQQHASAKETVWTLGLALEL